MHVIINTVKSRFRWPLLPPYRIIPIALVLFFGLGGGFIAATMNLKDELVEGPNRPLVAVTQPGDFWVFQKGVTNMVEDSFIPVEVATRLQQEGFQAVPFSRTYRPITFRGETLNVLAFDVPAPELKRGEQGVVVDESLGLNIGDDFTLAGQVFQVTGLASGTSSPGKEAVFLPREAFASLVAEKQVSGVLVKGSEPPATLREDYQVLSAQELLDANAEYWLLNGGSLTLVVAANVELYTAVVVVAILLLSFALTRRSTLTLRAVGARSGQVAAIESLYLLVLWVVSLPLQAGFCWLIVEAFRASTPGYIGTVGFSQLLYGAVAMLVLCFIVSAGLRVYAAKRYTSRKLAALLSEA